jgi:hypothetical protein
MDYSGLMAASGIAIVRFICFSRLAQMQIDTTPAGIEQDVC